MVDASNADELGNGSSGWLAGRAPRLRRRRRLRLTLIRRHRRDLDVVSITAGGPGLDGFRYAGEGHRLTMLVPWPPGARELLSWSAAEPFAAATQYWFVYGLTRPVRQAVAVTDFRADSLEIDVDVPVGGDSLLSLWLLHARPGGAVEMIDRG